MKKGETCGTWDCREPVVARSKPFIDDASASPVCELHAREAEEDGIYVWPGRKQRDAVTPRCGHTWTKGEG